MSDQHHAAPIPVLKNPGANSDLEVTIDSAALPADFPVPDLGSIGPYRLIRKLGEGGMGQVWLAEQPPPVKRQIALKIIKAGRYDNSALRRFNLERQTLAIMDHPVIAKVFDAGSTPEGQPYFVMEYVPGLPITQYCDQKRLSPRDRLALFTQVCEGVQHAHQKAIIHRDLKPSNILVVEVDGKPIPRIIDFGIAKAISQQSQDEALVAPHPRTEHPYTLTATDELAQTLGKEGRYQEAEKLARETLEIQRRVLGPDHPDAAATAYDLAGILAQTGRSGEAISILREAIDHGLDPVTNRAMATDPELKSLRKDPRFEALVSYARQRAAAPNPN